MGAVLHTGCQKWGVRGGKSCKAALMMPEVGWRLCCKRSSRSNLRVNAYGMENTSGEGKARKVIGRTVCLLHWSGPNKVSHLASSRLHIGGRGGNVCCKPLPCQPLCTALFLVTLAKTSQASSQNIFSKQKSLQGCFFCSSLNMKRPSGPEKAAAKAASMLIS